MSTAENRELIALRTHLATHLDQTDAKTLAWPVVASAAGPGIGRGWGGAELAAASMLGAYSGGVDSVPAYVITNLRALAEQDPPRQRTETPPPVQAVLADIHHGHQPSTRTAEHLATIRQTIRRNP